MYKRKVTSAHIFIIYAQPNMKREFALCSLVLTFACLQAAPMSWHDLLPAKRLEKGGVGEFWRDCSNSNDSLRRNSLEVTPDPPVRGKSVNITANLTFMEGVSGGEVKVDIKYDILGVPVSVFKDSLDLCELVKDARMKCPIKAGTYSFTLIRLIPNETKKGHFTGGGVATDQDGKELLCIDIDLTLP